MISFDKGLFIHGNFWDVHIYGSYLFMIDVNQNLIKLKLTNILNSILKSPNKNSSFNQLLLDRYSEFDISNVHYNKYQIFKNELMSNVIDSFFTMSIIIFLTEMEYIEQKIIHGKDISSQLDTERLIKGYFTSIKMYKNILYAASLNKGIYIIHFEENKIKSIVIDNKIHSSLVFPTRIGTIINSYTKNSQFLHNSKTKLLDDVLIKDIFTDDSKILYIGNKFYKIGYGRYAEYQIKNKGLRYKEYQIEKHEQIISFNISNNILFLEYKNKLILLQNGVKLNEFELTKDFIDWKIYPNSLKYKNHLHLITTKGIFIKII